MEIIKEEDFVPLANAASNNMLGLCSYFQTNKDKKFSKRLYAALFNESTELEEFLDDHGARTNKKWLYFGEIVASIRNLSSTAFIINHIQRRIKFYKLQSKNINAFIADSQKRLDFLNKSILALLCVLEHEAHDLGLTIPRGKFSEHNVDEIIVIKTLPHDIDDEGVMNIDEHISHIATSFIEAYNLSDSVLFEKKITAKDIEGNVIPDKINEETLRFLETHVHNAQSMYDTYVHKTPYESQNKLLQSLRGHISITLHLLGVARMLSHFFERHESTVRKEHTRKKIAKIITRKKILDIIINFALYHYTVFVKEGHHISEQILDCFTVVAAAVVNVPEGLGFHLRPSTLVAKISNHYNAKVHMIINKKEFDASSVIDLMWAGGMVKKEEIKQVEFRGDKHAVEDLKILAAANYGEDTMGNSTPLPEQLSYLRQD